MSSQCQVGTLLSDLMIRATTTLLGFKSNPDISPGLIYFGQTTTADYHLSSSKQWHHKEIGTANAKVSNAQNKLNRKTENPQAPHIAKKRILLRHVFVDPGLLGIGEMNSAWQMLEYSKYLKFSV